MTLADYLAESGITMYAFAGRVSWELHEPFDRENIRRYLLPAEHRDHRMPIRKVRIAIAAASGGLVTPNDWDGVPAAPVPAAPRDPSLSARGGVSRRKRRAA